MPRLAKPMTAQQVVNAKQGRHGLGNGLYLLVRENGTRFWLFRWTREGRMREMGLGRAPGRLQDHAAVPLRDATETAGRLLKMVRAGLDPIAEKQRAEATIKAEAQDAAIRGITFRAVAAQYIEAHGKAWENAKHAKQWEATLKAYAFPTFGDIAVADVGTEHIVAALQPIWATKAETATRVRGRVESILNYATTRGWRTGENPARWRGHLANLLPARGKVAPVEHHPALPWGEMAGFLTALKEQAGVGALALQFTILTAARSGEVLGARWGEVDLSAKAWTIPAERMKAGREHRVPLSAPVLALLGEMAKMRTEDAQDEFVFPGALKRRPLSVMAMTMVLRRMKRDDLTVHGFRSTFRDWTAETTNYPRDVAEAALAHTLGDKVEAAYRRGDLFEKRTRLMDAWAGYCTRPANKGGTISTFRPRDTADTGDTKAG